MWMTLSSEMTEGEKELQLATIESLKTRVEGHFKLKTVKNGEMVGEKCLELRTGRSYVRKVAGYLEGMMEVIDHPSELFL